MILNKKVPTPVWYLILAGFVIGGVVGTGLFFIHQELTEESTTYEYTTCLYGCITSERYQNHTIRPSPSYNYCENECWTHYNYD